MNTELNKPVYDHILVRYGELTTKGKNRKDFINRLVHNMRNALREFDRLEYEKTHDRLYIHLHESDHEAVCERIRHVFGIRSFSLAMKVPSTIEDIRAACLQIANASDKETFKVAARRSDKQFSYISDEINRIVAGDILKTDRWKVDVKNPQLKITIEVHQGFACIMTDVMLGAGGYPVGIGGKAMVMLSGGIDSPVAAYLTMKRGIAIECIHYASPPYTSQRAQEKVEELARLLAHYQGHITLHIVPFTDLQLAIYEHGDESYAITLMRRMMYHIAAKLAQKQHALAIVNGESIGQVASQTLESMNVINSVVTMPVIRPVAALDKLEIIEIAKQIDTYETSIQPFEDCCTIFTPKNPVTKPTAVKCEKLESRFDWEKLVDACVENTKVVQIYPAKQLEEADLF